MTHQRKNKIKASFLLVVFSLNTVAGFACSVGVDLGYNTNHNGHSKKHEHGHGQNLKKTGASHSHKSNGAFSVENPKGYCCSNYVSKFTLLDKSVATTIYHLQDPPVFFKTFTSTFDSQAQNEPGVSSNSGFQVVRRSCFLNNMDIRVAIQSFRI